MSAAQARRPKVDVERTYFEWFRVAYSLPPGTITYGDKPDVVLIGERKIGIEITNFFLQPGSNPDSEQRQKPWRTDVVAQAHALYLADGGRGIGLTLSFNPRCPISKERKRKLPGELAELVRQHNAHASGPVRVFIPEISNVHLISEEHTDAKWRVQNSYNIELMKSPKLEGIIREKEAKSVDYGRCDAYWLLIVVDGMDTAQDQEIRIDDLSISSSMFERIIIYKPGFEHIVEVQQ